MSPPQAFWKRKTNKWGELQQEYYEFIFLHMLTGAQALLFRSAFSKGSHLRKSPFKTPLLTEELNGTTEASELHVASLAQSRPFKSQLALLRWLPFSVVLRIETREPQSLFTISITKSSKWKLRTRRIFFDSLNIIGQLLSAHINLVYHEGWNSLADPLKSQSSHVHMQYFYPKYEGWFCYSYKAWIKQERLGWA